MGYWYSLPTLNWFAMEPNPHGTHDVVSFNFHPLFMSLAILCLMSEGTCSPTLQASSHGGQLLSGCVLG
jgi:hypothetical protein